MEKEFYYLDGKEQKGPFKTEYLKSVGLKPDTLVWTEGFDNWKPVREVEDLRILLKKTPPPPPIIDNTPSSTAPINKVKSDNKNIIVEDNNVKLWAEIKLFFFIIFLFSLIGLLGYSYVSTKKNNFKKSISEKISNIFDNKTVILDGEKFGVQGEIEDTGYKGNSNKQKEDSFTRERWWERDGLYSIYTCTSGGFTVKKLTKLSDESFDLETYYSGDMGYRKPAFYRGVTGWSYGRYGEHKEYGDISNYLKPIQNCYNEAFDFFTVEDKTASYTPGKFVEITNFPDLRNEYFYMDNTEPRKHSSSGQFSSEWWSIDDHTANVYWDDARVYYSSRGKHYELTLNKDKFIRDLLITLGISFGILLIVIITFSLSKPKFFRNLYLYGKRWKNIAYEEQVLFFEHSFFGKHTFTEIINDNVSKGVLKITDKGNTINLSYLNKELFYKIDKISLDNLSTISLKDESIISFQRIGAKEKKKEEYEEKINIQESIKNGSDNDL